MWGHHNLSQPQGVNQQASQQPQTQQSQHQPQSQQPQHGQMPMNKMTLTGKSQKLRNHISRSELFSLTKTKKISFRLGIATATKCSNKQSTKRFISVKTNRMGRAITTDTTSQYTKL